MKLSFDLDHIGIAVSSLDTGSEFYKKLGFSEMKTETVASESVKVGFLPMGNDCSIELLEPTSSESPIAKFLDKRGPGIHHICLRVKNIEQVAKSLSSQGVRLINEVPRPGAHNCKVVFVHPKSTGGILLELSEKVEDLDAK